MDTTASPRIRQLALIGLIAAVGLAGGLFFMSRTQTDPGASEPLPPPAVIKPKPAAVAKAKPVAVAKAKPAPVAKAKPKPAAPAAPTTTPAAKPKPATVKAKAAAVEPKPKAKPRLIAASGLPMSIARQLATHKVVVVALYATGAAVDTLARDEARAGARDASVGFAAVDVSNKKIAAALARKTAVFGAPAVLVFVKGGDVEARLDGFADRVLVAELAASAR